MKCFHHPERDAVGICKACNKGLCVECAVDIGNGIACRNSCEEEVKSINKIIDKSRTAYAKTGKAHKSVALAFAIIGILFLISGITSAIISRGENIIADCITTAFGAVFLILAGIFVSYGKRIDRTE